MTPAEFRETLAALGVSQLRLAVLLRVNRNTPNNWAKGHTEIPHAVAVVLRALRAGRLAEADLS